MNFPKLARWRRARALTVALSLGCGMAMTAPAAADMIDIESYPADSAHMLGTFTGTIEYGFDVPLDEWTLLITLTNTSPEENGGYLTGFIFNINSSDSNASATLHGSHAPFVNAANQSDQNFGGAFDAGAAIGGSFQGGGPPAGGIGVGDTMAFLFIVSASDAAFLTAEDFISGPYEYNFLVRFRGFENGGSDKVPGVSNGGPPIPGPAALMAFAVGLIFYRRRGQTV